MADNNEDSLMDEWYNKKTAMMETLLGEEHNIVMHAMIPYSIGGNLDLYYYPNGISGCAIATKELCETHNSGSSNDVFRNYEIVMFTRHHLSVDDATNENTPFGRAHLNIDAILNHVAPYSALATLNPFQTCEFPDDMEMVGGKCLIFDAYKFDDKMADFGLLLVIEVFRQEMDFARKHGGRQLLSRLKDAGFYPYSDLDREAVV